MVETDITDLKIQLIEDVVKKKRKTSEVADILKVWIRTIQKRMWKYKIHGIQGLIRSKPWPKQWSPYNKTKEETEEIVAFYGLKYKREWPERLKMKLDEIGVKLHQTTIYRILKRRKIRYYGDYERVKTPCKLYCLDFPWQEMQMDTWYPFWRHRKFVIYSIIDDCTRLAYSKAYESACVENTKDFIKEIIKRFQFNILSIRTDQWREFSKTITKFLEEKNIEHIKNEPYHPEHNWKIERYHLTENMWEVIHWAYLISIEEANYMLRNWLSYYNFSRKHLGFGMKKLSPWAKYLETKDKKRT